MAIPRAQHQVTQQNTSKARSLRREMSLAEKLLWHELRQMPKDLEITFRRQQVIHPYITDFACLRLKLLIELDGASHDNRQSYDARRDAYLLGCGYTTLRFTNDDVLKDAAAVVETILLYIREHASA